MKKNIHSILVAILMFILFLSVSSLLVGFILVPIGSITIATLLGRVVFIIPFYYVLFKKTGISFLNHKSSRLCSNPRMIWRLIGMGIVLALITNIFVYLVNGKCIIYQYHCFSTTELVSLFVTYLLLGPISEELFFRKWMMDYLEQKDVKPWIILILTSVLFFLGHVANLETWYYRLDSLLFALVTGYLYYRYKNIKYCIFVHFVNNLVVNSINLSNYLLQ